MHVDIIIIIIYYIFLNNNRYNTHNLNHKNNFRRKRFVYMFRVGVREKTNIALASA